MPENPSPEPPRTFLGNLVAIVGGLIAAVYLVNPTAGFIELIPDNIPFFGNLDEAAAAAILIAALAHFGFDVTKIFSKKAGVSPTPQRGNKTMDVDAEEVKK
jgi:uncharacterized membrane protein YkvA (DUF1232 family)